MGAKRDVFKILVGKLKGRENLDDLDKDGRQDNIKMDVNKIGCGWVHLCRVLVNTVMNFRVP
jgi:hypothetical protein